MRDEIMITASGDLSHPILDLGIDEIGVLGKELDALRTPLTILNGYLEVLKLGGSRNIRKLKVIRLHKSVRKMTEEIGAAMTVKEDIQYFTVEIVFSEKE